MKIVVAPRGDDNPYQELLYAELRSLGVEVAYLGSLTPSYTLNLLLMPFELVLRRIWGASIVHLHWTYNFGYQLYGTARFNFVGHLTQLWFYMWLRTLRLLGMRLVWTAHNTLPAGKIFADDVAARQRLVASADLVIAHSKNTLSELARLGMTPRKSVVIPHGPYSMNITSELTAKPDWNGDKRVFLFFGKIEPYKGVDNLLAAFGSLSREDRCELSIVGECGDLKVRRELELMAQKCASPVVLRFERIPESEVTKLLLGADVVVLPYRKITTSGSAVLALSHGRPLIIPDLPGLSELPDEAVVRYDESTQGLAKAIRDLGRIDVSVLDKMSSAGLEYCASVSWDSIARLTYDQMRQCLAMGLRGLHG